MLYNGLIRPFLFNLWKDPEDAHEFAMGLLETVAKSAPLLGLTSALLSKSDPRLQQTIFDNLFPNPVGLAGGFDKNCRALAAWEALGYGFIEAGTITRHAQPGNPRQRVFRFPAEKALINRFGFNNDGADAVAQRLASARKPKKAVIGISLGKSKITPVEEAVEDYITSLRLLYPYGKYFAINVSSPNTPGLRNLQDRSALTELVNAMIAEAEILSKKENALKRKPILVKIAPDLEPTALNEVLEVCQNAGIDGLIATNTTLSRDGLNTITQETGGLSGAPLFARSLAIIKHIRKELPQMPVIGVGGIMNSNDAWDMLRAGANLLQVYTGAVYNGPRFAADLNKGILKQMDRHGIKNITEIHQL